MTVAHVDALDRPLGAAHVRGAGLAVPVRLLHEVQAAGRVVRQAAFQGLVAGFAGAVAAKPRLANLKRPGATIALRATGASLSAAPLELGVLKHDGRHLAAHICAS